MVNTIESSAPSKSTNKDKKKILLVDDHPIVRQGLQKLIGQEKDLVVCGEAEDDREALAIIEAEKPDIALVDLTLKRGSGLDLIKNIKTRFPDTKVIVLSMHEASLYAERTLRAGAKGYIMKQDANEKVLVTIRRVLEGEIYVGEKTASWMLSKLAGGKIDSNESEIHQLSNRELEVFQLIGQGKGTRQIAEKLYLSIKTVETYRENIKEKMNLSSATELVHYASRWVQNHLSSS